MRQSLREILRYTLEPAAFCILYAVCYYAFCLAVGAEPPPLWVPLNEPAAEHEHFQVPEPPRTERSIALEQAARDSSNSALETGACTFCE